MDYANKYLTLGILYGGINIIKGLENSIKITELGKDFAQFIANYFDVYDPPNKTYNERLSVIKKAKDVAHKYECDKRDKNYVAEIPKLLEQFDYCGPFITFKTTGCDQSI